MTYAIPDIHGRYDRYTTLRKLNRLSLDAREEILGANRSNKP